MAEHIVSARTYIGVFIALLLLLGLTIGLSFVDFGRYLNNSIAVAIAIAKAMLIILIFMHVKYSPRLNWFFVGAGFLWLGILLVLTMSDYLTRNHPPGVNYRGEPEFLQTPPPQAINEPQVR